MRLIDDLRVKIAWPDGGSVLLSEDDAGLMLTVLEAARDYCRDELEKSPERVDADSESAASFTALVDALRDAGEEFD